MASTKEYNDYVCDQIAKIGEIRSRKMFGEYMVYINNKPLILVCDNTPYVRMAKEISHLIETSSTGYPYNGAKLHYILDI